MQTEAYTEEAASPVRPDTFAEDTHTGVVSRKDWAVLNTLDVVEEWESSLHRWLMRHSITALRISMGAVIFGFGFLKYFPGVSPAEGLVLAATRVLTFGLLPDGLVMVLLATLECTIGLLLITGRWLRLTSYLFTFWVLGILSPIVLLPGRIFAGPHHMPTLEGQYVLKDVILFAAAMVIATTVRGGAITDGAHRG